MRYYLLVLLSVGALLPFCQAQAQAAAEVTTTVDDEVSELVRRYVESRVNKPLFWKPCLNVGADVRFQYDHYNKFRTNERIIHEDGTTSLLPKFLPQNAVAVNGNIYLEYDTRRTWAKLQIEAVNPGGTFPRKLDRIRTKRAIMGYNILCCGKTRWYVELGRQQLSEHFDSQVQYGSRLDGLFTRFSMCLPRLGETWVQAAYMVVNVEDHQYAWIAAIGAEDIFGTCTYVKLSIVDWTNGGRFTPPLLDQLGFVAQTTNRTTDLGYVPGQILVGKKFCKGPFGKKVKIYGGAIYNFKRTPRTVFEPFAVPVAITMADAAQAHRVLAELKALPSGVPPKKEDLKDEHIAILKEAAAKLAAEYGTREDRKSVKKALLGQLPPGVQGNIRKIRGNRFAAFAGIQLGEVCKCGDWALKAVYEYVQPFAYLPSDNAGIGRSDANDDIFFVIDFDTFQLATNYHGVHLEAAYSVTDHITARLQYQHSHHITGVIGGPSIFNRFMFRFMYAF